MLAVIQRTSQRSRSNLASNDDSNLASNGDSKRPRIPRGNTGGDANQRKRSGKNEDLSHLHLFSTRYLIRITIIEAWSWEVIRGLK